MLRLFFYRLNRLISIVRLLQLLQEIITYHAYFERLKSSNVLSRFIDVLKKRVFLFLSFTIERSDENSRGFIFSYFHLYSSFEMNCKRCVVLCIACVWSFVTKFRRGVRGASYTRSSSYVFFSFFSFFFYKIMER